MRLLLSALLCALCIPFLPTSDARACSSQAGHPVGFWPQPGSVAAPQTTVGIAFRGYEVQPSDLTATLTHADGTVTTLESPVVESLGLFGELMIFTPASPLPTGQYTLNLEYPPLTSPAPNLLDTATFTVDAAAPLPTALDAPVIDEWAMEWRDAVLPNSCGPALEVHKLTVTHPAAGLNRALFYEVAFVDAAGVSHDTIVVNSVVSPAMYGTRGEQGDPTIEVVPIVLEASCVEVRALDQYGNQSDTVSLCTPHKCRKGSAADLFWDADFSTVAGCEGDDVPPAIAKPDSGCSGGERPTGVLLALWILVLVATSRRRHHSKRHAQQAGSRGQRRSLAAKAGPPVPAPAALHRRGGLSVLGQSAR